MPAMTMGVIGLVLLAAAPKPDIRNSKHNLSSTSSNTVRSSTTAATGTVTTDEVCVFCHTPHKATQSKPIWNRDLAYQSGTGYQLYSSSTLNAAVARPNGASKLCLSCHDGTVGLGSLMNLNAGPKTVAMAGAGPGGTMPAGRTNLGTDLRNDHPISMALTPEVVAADGDLAQPAATDAVRLHEGATAGRKDTVQCTSCHDPHLPSTTNPKFLVKDNTRGALCTTCHPKAGWVGSMHEKSQAAYPASGAQKVADLACMACHTPHNAQSPSRLLSAKNLSGTSQLSWAEENVCFSCHKNGGTGVDSATGRAAPNIEAEFAKAGSKHPFALKTDEHQPVFTKKDPSPEPTALTSKHVECADCHNPHQVQPIVPGNDSNVHRGMKGIGLDGKEVVDSPERPIRQFEICFRCHSDTFDTFIPPAATRTTRGSPASTATSGSNKRFEFQPTNTAYHPVTATGRNQSNFLNNINNGGQLKGTDWEGRPMSKLSTLLCTDCHNNNATGSVEGSARNAPASAIKGPHGSTNTRLLRASFSTQRGGTLSERAGLCFLCHDQDALLGDRSNFRGGGKGNLHNYHLSEKTDASCADCHNNVHSNLGASNTQYVNLDAGEPTHLINFSASARGLGNPLPQWGRVSAPNPARPDPNPTYFCRLTCHGSDDKMDGSDSRYTPSQP